MATTQRSTRAPSSARKPATTRAKAKKVTRAAKVVVAKGKPTGRAAAKKKHVATAGGVRKKAKKLATKIQSVQHSASDLTMRVGSTMEAIGSALMSLVTPAADVRPAPASRKKS